MIFLEDPVWFSPINFIHHANILNKSLTPKEKKTKEFRKVIEAYSVAQMLLGVIARENREYWMQLVDDKHGTPDIRTIRYADLHRENFDDMEQVDVEVVEYEEHSMMSVPEFIVKKKFSEKKSYDKNTVILCHLGGKILATSLPEIEDIDRIMNAANISCMVIFLVASNPDATRLKLIQMRPSLGLLIEFDMFEAIHSRKYTGVINLKRGTRRPLEHYPNNKRYPFEKLGYIPNERGEYLDSSRWRPQKD